MADLRHLLAKESERHELSAGAFRRLALRRDRKRQRARILASALALILVVATTALLARAFLSPRHTSPAEPALPAGDFLGVIRPDGTGFRGLTRPGPGSRVLLCCPSWQPSASGANGQIAFARRAHLVLLDPAHPGAQRTLVKGVSPAWSPDGTWIAFMRGEGVRRIGQADIPWSSLWVIRANGTGLRRLVEGPYGELGFRPTWAPDSRRIAFSSAIGGTDGIDVINLDGTGLHRIPTPGLAAAMPAWSPDGKTIAFVGIRAEQIYLMKADGTDIRRITDLKPAAQWPSWSPDGRRLVFVGGGLIVWVINRDGTGLRRLATHAAYPAWSPDGKWIALLREGPTPTPVSCRSGSPQASPWPIPSPSVVSASADQFIVADPKGCIRWTFKVNGSECRTSGLGSSSGPCDQHVFQDGNVLLSLSGVSSYSRPGPEYNVTFGRLAPAGQYLVSVLLYDHRQVSIRPVHGMWILVVPHPYTPCKPSYGLYEVHRIQALLPSGQVIGSVTYPQLPRMGCHASPSP